MKFIVIAMKGTILFSYLTQLRIDNHNHQHDHSHAQGHSHAHVDKPVHDEKIVYIEVPVPVEKIVYQDKIVEKFFPQIQEKVVYIDRPIEIEKNKDALSANNQIMENQVERISQILKDKQNLIVENNRYKKKEIELTSELNNIK